MQKSWFRVNLCTYAVILLWSFAFASDDPLCFQVTQTNCTDSLKNGQKCTKISQDTSTSQMYCCNITTEAEIREYIMKLRIGDRLVLAFHLRDSNISRLNINLFNDLPDLTSLAITESTITRLDGMLDRHEAISCFNLSRNQFTDISPNLIFKLRTLKNVDMSFNNVSVLPDLPPAFPSFFRLDVSANKHLQCKYLINLTLTLEEKNITITLVNKNDTVCLPPNAKLFDSVKLITWEELESVKAIFRDCPHINDRVKCECSIYSLDMSDERNSQTFLYQGLVNCSNKQMTALPKVLPPNTRVLDISNNSITSFDGIGNETYNSIRELYADNNKITSLKPLEGTSFLYNFQNLTLRNNKIDQIQEYMLSNVFDRNLGKTLLLAKNELRCDCNTASHTKMWLTANKAHIPDYDQIFTICESPIKILDLDQKDVCTKPTNWKDYIRYLIVFEVTLFVLLVGKVSYDYYVFKTAGYLPWPASKMPKLPCDWCFET